MVSSGWRQKSPKVLGDFHDRRQFVNLRLCDSKQSKCYKRSDRSGVAARTKRKAYEARGSEPAQEGKPKRRPIGRNKKNSYRKV